MDIDLAKFFDTVNHDKLITILTRTIHDGDVISIIRKFLVSGVMTDNKIEDTEVGTPQGGNLSPLLANIILNELDMELSDRGLEFVRYADDCIIIVNSRQAARRVMDSITNYLETNLKLTVNQSKSKITRSTGLKFLGFGFYHDTNSRKFKALPHRKSKDKLLYEIRKLTSRSWGVGNDYKVLKLNQLIRGWVNYFSLGSMLKFCMKTDALIRTRLRMCIWKHWKTPQNRAKNLMKLGISEHYAWTTAYTGRRIAYICTHGAVLYAITNKRLSDFGLLSMTELYNKAISTC